LPSLEFTPDEDIPLDLTDAFVKSLEFLMLAQAQECVWQKAVMGKYIYICGEFIDTHFCNLDQLKNGLIAKLARKVG
jgi:programmed cell death 6-interacting protein